MIIYPVTPLAINLLSDIEIIIISAEPQVIKPKSILAELHFLFYRQLIQKVIN